MLKEIKKIREGDSIPANAKFLYSQEEPGPKLGSHKPIKYNYFEIERPDLPQSELVDKTIKINMEK
jgi:hypothetical protein